LITAGCPATNLLSSSASITGHFTTVHEHAVSPSAAATKHNLKPQHLAMLVARATTIDICHIRGSRK
jgi:hypothetical protein